MEIMETKPSSSLNKVSACINFNDGERLYMHSSCPKTNLIYPFFDDSPAE